MNQHNANTLTRPNKKFEIRDNKEYKFEIINNSVICTKKAESQLLGLYYQVLFKSYPKKHQEAFNGNNTSQKVD